MAEKTPIAFVTGDAELGAQLYAALRAEFDVAVEYDAFKALDDFLGPPQIHVWHLQLPL